MSKFLLFAMLFTHPAHADTYVPVLNKAGSVRADAPIAHCASPAATTRLNKFVAALPKVTIGHGQMTIRMEGDDGHEVVRGADRVRPGGVGEFDIPGQSGGTLTIIVDVMPLGWCLDAMCTSSTPAMRVAMKQTYQGNTCSEIWRGDAKKLGGAP